MSPALASRREFLAQVTTAGALGMCPRVLGRDLWRFAADDLVPEVEEALLRRLAATALEAARAAGAGFADVRVVGARRFYINGHFIRPNGERPGTWPGLDLRTEYGVRVVVDGSWGVASGSVLTADAAAHVARMAVARARASRLGRPRQLELAPVPRVETGRWATPIVEDPFAVSIQEQCDLILAALTRAEAVSGALSAGVQFEWTQQVRVFASSEGSLAVQRIAVARPRASASGQAQADLLRVDERVESLRRGGYGYEVIRRVDLVADLRQAVELAVIKSRAPVLPSVATEVGRYDLVLGGRAVGALLRFTLGEALNAERALGYRANDDGTSFAAPPAEILGTYQIASPLITLKADRTRPDAFATVGWDDEGAPAEEFTLVDQGVVTSYLTSRQTAMEVAAGRAGGGAGVRSRACASGVGATRPEVRCPNLTLVAGPQEVSVEDLIADTRRGYYLEGLGSDDRDDRWDGDGVDQQLLNGQFMVRRVREIKNGKLGGWMSHFAFQFLTPQLWKQVDAIGGPKSGLDIPFLTDKTFNWMHWLQLRWATVHAVPMRVRQVNVLNVGRTV